MNKNTNKHTKKEKMKPEIFLQALNNGVNPSTGEVIDENKTLKESGVFMIIGDYLKNNRLDTQILSDDARKKIQSGDLFYRLRGVRMNLSNKIGWKPYTILGNEALLRLIFYKVKTLQEAKNIKHIGPKNIKFVPFFLAEINNEPLSSEEIHEILKELPDFSSSQSYSD